MREAAARADFDGCHGFDGGLVDDATGLPADVVEAFALIGELRACYAAAVAAGDAMLLAVT